MKSKNYDLGVSTVEVKNLSQLKNILKKGAEFHIVSHCRAEDIGERRRVNIANTVGIYSINIDDPECKTTKANGGRGTFLSWYKAQRWEFQDDGVCALYSNGKEKTPENLLVAFKIISTGTEQV